MIEEMLTALFVNALICPTNDWMLAATASAVISCQRKDCECRCPNHEETAFVKESCFPTPATIPYVTFTLSLLPR